MTDVKAEIARLHDLVSNARAMPMSASAVVNRAEVLDMIDRIQRGWVEATSESSAVVAEQERHIAEGEAKARETIRLAELERDQLVSDTEVFRLATREAERIRSEAARESEQLRRDADTYIEQRFANFEHALDRTLNEVRRGIANLSGRSSFAGEGNDGIGEGTGIGEGGGGTHAATGDDVLLSGHDDR